MFDIKSIVTLDSAVLELTHPETGEPLGAKLILAGPENLKRKKMEAERAARFLELAVQGKRSRKIDPEEEWDRATEYLVACTLGWEGFSEDGKPLEFSPEAARRIYADPNLSWLRRAVETFLGEPLNFIRSSPRPS